jgi:capsule synthesis protein PGA_cap
VKHACVALLAAACGGGGATPVARADAATPDAAMPDAPAPDARPPAGGLAFSDSCAAGDRIVVAAVGDVLLHEPLQKQAYAMGHDSLWHDVAPLLHRAGAAYANLEGPVAPGVNSAGDSVTDPGPVFDDYVYTSFPQFNYHPSLIPALVAAGFSEVSTANNHAMDRNVLGIDRTLASLSAPGLPASGTRRDSDASPRWVSITEQGGFKLGWVACTFSTNLPDPDHLVLLCDTDEATVVRLVRDLAPQVDAVIVTPHGGDEYSQTPAARQIKLAADVLDAGAIAVFGNHPHVLQPWIRHVTPDGRETFAIYSIGNFVSAQDTLEERTSIVLYLGLVRAGGRTRPSWVGYVTTLMQADPIYTVRPADVSLDAWAPAALAHARAMLDPENELASSAELPACR